MTLPAYARDVFARRQSGQSISLVVVALHDWAGGEWFRGKPGVMRVVVPDDLPILDVDWSFATALDCVVVGLPEDDEGFYAAAKLLNAAGAASVWGSFDDGLWRLTPWHGHVEMRANEGPVAPDAILVELTLLRHVGLMRGTGIYREPIFREARILAYAETFGAEVAEKLRTRIAA